MVLLSILCLRIAPHAGPMSSRALIQSLALLWPSPMQTLKSPFYLLDTLQNGPTPDLARTIGMIPWACKSSRPNVCRTALLCLKALQEIQEISHIPIIMLTAKLYFNAVIAEGQAPEASESNHEFIRKLDNICEIKCVD
ncbi:uncharacterized protein EAE97_007532 [Botrytis byssoidea]|uniref:Uncharacterized protein n=1 Tax=Botrytis byssoidea TaxID=139641 RepID=A0A9P5IFQ0_9HELO|nr:uncharacterized protein EAE97_007532 [Botrytis byssoidea]KAF7937736.1 hypothetical protein EAE97_007532 [Botrytis byssoidea]